MPMLPWPVWPLAAQATLGQNVVAGSIRLSSESCWGTYPEEVCLDPHFHGKHTIPRLSVELPRFARGSESRNTRANPPESGCRQILKAKDVDHTHAAGSNHVRQRDVDVLWNLPWAGRATHL